MFYSVVFVCILNLLRLSLGGREQKFFAGILCDSQQRIDAGCSKIVTKYRNKNACVFGCAKDAECVGASIENKHTCFHHYTCAAVSGCTSKADEHKYLSKNCAHGGVWEPITETCTCVNGWVGKQCVDLPSKCSDLVEKGINRVYLTLKNTRISKPPEQPVPVYCSVVPDGPHYSVQAFRNFGDENKFNQRTWDEYKNGFLLDVRNSWIGLKNWHLVSHAGYSRAVVYLNLGDRYRAYTQFYVHNESNGFSFSYHTSRDVKRNNVGVIGINNLGDCFEQLQNVPFSSKDRDQDGATENCADVTGSGWWFAGNCSLRCNLLGLAPKSWDSVPANQWMRYEGIDPEDLKNVDKPAGMIMYLKYE